MCFLAVLNNVVPDYPLVVAANRDESYDRPGTPPIEIAPGVWAGRDPAAGGTWLGVGRGGIVVAVANIRSDRPPRRDARSRGLLCLDLLKDRAFGRLVSVLRESVEAAAYNEFNLLAAGEALAWVATWTGGRLEIHDLPPGVHVIGNRPFGLGANDDPKVVRGRSLVHSGLAIEPAIENLKRVCGDHGVRPDRQDAICVHGQQSGTLSSSIIAIAAGPPHRSVYLHAGGRPCETEYRHLFVLLDNHVYATVCGRVPCPD